MGRRKLTEDRKRKKISTTIDNHLWDLLDKYATETNQKKSHILEKWITDGLVDSEIIEKLKDDNIILPDSDL